MIRSMTGYGRSQQMVDGRDITVEIKSVNHRYFEFNSRVPRAYGYLEERLKSYVQSKVSRGKVEVGVTVITVEADTADVQVNHQLAKSYLDALRKMGQALGVKDDLTLNSLSRFPDIFTVRKNTEDEEYIWGLVKGVADQAVGAFVQMREHEGEKLRQDVLCRADAILKNVEFVKERSPATVAEYRARLTAKINEVLSDTSVDEQRILTEAAIFAEKTAVDEETVRLESHLDQLSHILKSDEPVGRKLDFLVQEINREANTIGSKASDLSVARIVVEIKSDIEKIREQIQNIE